MDYVVLLSSDRRFSISHSVTCIDITEEISSPVSVMLYFSESMTEVCVTLFILMHFFLQAVDVTFCESASYMHEYSVYIHKKE